MTTHSVVQAIFSQQHMFNTGQSLCPVQCMSSFHSRILLLHTTYPQDLHMPCMENIEGPINVDNG
jgi:hypothetical protein